MFKNLMIISLLATSGLLTSCSVPSYANLNPVYATNNENLKNDEANEAEKLTDQIEKLIPSAEIKVVGYSYNILVVGEVKTIQDKNAITQLLEHSPNIKRSWNYVTISNKPRLRINNSLKNEIMDRVKLEKNIEPRHVVIAVVSGTVYVLGTNIGNLTYFERTLRGIQSLEGVDKIVNLTQPGPKDYYSLEQNSY